MIHPLSTLQVPVLYMSNNRSVTAETCTALIVSLTQAGAKIVKDAHVDSLQEFVQGTKQQHVLTHPEEEDAPH